MSSLVSYIAKLECDLEAANDRVRELEVSRETLRTLDEWQKGRIQELETMNANQVQQILAEKRAVDSARADMRKAESELAAFRKPGPATDAELSATWDGVEEDTWEASHRAVYDLGVSHGRQESPIRVAREWKDRAEKAEAMYQNAVNDQMRMAEASRPVEPPADLVEAVAKAIDDADDVGMFTKPGYLARAALAVIQPEIDRLKAALGAYQRQFAELVTAVGELTKERDQVVQDLNTAAGLIEDLTKERDAWQDKEERMRKMCLANSPVHMQEELALGNKQNAELRMKLSSATDRIAELTKERDDAETAYKCAFDAAGKLQDRIAELTRPTELTDEEIDRLRTTQANAFGLSIPPGYEWSPDQRRGIRALLAAAGRYVAPTEDEPYDYRRASDPLKKVMCEHLDTPIRLPYVGLTKEEAQELRERCRTAQFAGCIHLIAKALGAGGGT